MRILLSFLIGLLSSFYLTELVIRLTHSPIKHSFLGLILFFLSISTMIIANQDPFIFLLSFTLLGTGLGLMAHHLLANSYLFSKNLEQNFVKKHSRGFERLIEILPGSLTWTALTSPIWLSFILPFAVAYLILLANIYWFLNAIKIAVLIYLGYKKIEYAKGVNWLSKLEQDFPNEWENYYHLIVLPTFKESLDVLKPAFDAVVNSAYPRDKIFLTVGFEERDDPEKIKQAIKYLAKLSAKIGGCLPTIHPFGLPGEIPGPGTNRNWMVKGAVEEFIKRGIKPEQVIVTTLDADFVIHPQFLAGALHIYLSTPESVRDKRTYTGAFLYYNNYWQTPAPMRLIAVGTQFWQLAEMVGSDKYMNFSSLSINMQSLLDIGLWIPDKVNDDSGFFWKAYFHFKGDYKVIPHFLPISADAVLDINLWKTFKNQYLQLKRWAYGVEHLPYVVTSYFKTTDIDFLKKTDMLLFAIWGYLRWGTLALLITFGSMLIPLINPGYSQSVVAYNLPVVSSWILTAAFISLFSTIFVHEKTVPQRPRNWSIIQRVWSYIQWVLIPLILVSISTIPAIDAQTTLMLGKYLEFRTTVKARLSQK